MLNKIYWQIPGRVIVTEYAGSVSVDEIVYGGETIAQLIDIKGQQPYVHAIIDTSKRLNVDDTHLLDEANIATIQQPLRQHPLAGWTVIIDPNAGRMNRWLRQITGRSQQSHYHICGSLDDALAFLNKQDVTLVNQIQSV
jgi:hypothetical protein